MSERKILDQFRVRDDTYRAKLVFCLAQNVGKQVSQTVLMDEVYGKKKGSRSAFTKVLTSVQGIIVRRKLPFEIVEQKRKKGVTIGLYYDVEKGSPVIARGGTVASLNSRGWFPDDNK